MHSRTSTVAAHGNKLRQSYQLMRTAIAPVVRIQQSPAPSIVSAHLLAACHCLRRNLERRSRSLITRWSTCKSEPMPPAPFCCLRNSVCVHLLMMARACVAVECSRRSKRPSWHQNACVAMHARIMRRVYRWLTCRSESTPPAPALLSARQHLHNVGTQSCCHIAAGYSRSHTMAQSTTMTHCRPGDGWFLFVRY